MACYYHALMWALNPSAVPSGWRVAHPSVNLLDSAFRVPLCYPLGDMRAALVVLVLVLAACGGSSPVAPAVPLPPPAASLTLDTSVPLTLRDTRAGWAFTGQGVNRGLGCAAKVRLTATFRDASQTVLETVAGDALPVQTIVLPNTPFTFEGCCMTRDLYATVPDVYVSITFQWDTVACPAF